MRVTYVEAHKGLLDSTAEILRHENHTVRKICTTKLEEAWEKLQSITPEPEAIILHKSPQGSCNREGDSQRSRSRRLRMLQLSNSYLDLPTRGPYVV